MKIKTVNYYLDLLSKRIKYYRVNKEMTQQDLADMSGVSSRTISRLEQGRSIQMESFINILMALEIDDNLEILVPDQTKRPSYYLEENINLNPRARKKDTVHDEFVWGEDKQ